MVYQNVNDRTAKLINSLRHKEKIRVLFVCVAPFALTTHAPAAYILEKPLLGLPGWAAYVVPLAGAAFLTLMYFVFRRALKDYRSTGS